MLRFGQPDETYYMTGGCPYFALAANRILGYDIALLVDRDGTYKSAFGPSYPMVAHVFVTVDGRTGFDILGSRPIEEIMDGFPNVRSAEILVVSRTKLRSLMGRGKPLAGYREDHIVEAQEAVARVLQRS